MAKYRAENVFWVPAEDDAEPFEDKMQRLTTELAGQFAESAKLEAAIRRNLAGLGFSTEVAK